MHSFFDRMRRNLFLLLIIICSFSAQAQQRLVEQVKKDIASLKVGADDYRRAARKLEPALNHDDTKDKADTWLLAGKIRFSLYDAMMKTRAAGKEIDKKEAATALLEGHEMMAKALSLDTVPILDKNGNPVIDKRTQRPKVKTRVSGRIVKEELTHLVDFGAAGGDLFMDKQWRKAYDAWGVYCELSQSPAAMKQKVAAPDSVVGYYRFFQGLAAYHAGEYDNAVARFSDALAKGYESKQLYDGWIDALIVIGDKQALWQVANRAFTRYGASERQYVNILINDYLKERKYEAATELLARAMELHPDDAQYVDLMGQITEAQHGHDAAEQYYRRAVEIDPDNTEASFHLGNVLYTRATLLDRSKDDRATALYRQALPFIEKAYERGLRTDAVRQVLSRLYYVLGSGKIDDL
ncbi:MAG: tetratricopeptide repeat protein [Muribaculaceae bacterium]|nr:tetratricopeptide repeat protein [Muribaculaceae bacterium]